jgi:MYXO-CTERM domain-containing protein
MRKLSWWSVVCALAWSGWGIGLSPAAAQECETDADCADGLTCTSYGEVSCDVACAEGDPNCGAQPACEPIELKACALPSCESDADCPSGTVCHSETYSECSESGGGAAECPPGADCPQPEPAPQPLPADCVERSTEPTCVPQYQLPCTSASDCGEGFDCVELVGVSCSGSAGSAGDPGSSGGGSSGFAPPSGDPAPMPPEMQCTEEPTGEFYCQAREVLCAADADCPASWSCMDNPERPVCSAPAERPAGDGSAGSGAGDAQPLPPPDCGVSDVPEKVCVPPYYGVGGVGIATRGDAVLEAGVGHDPNSPASSGPQQMNSAEPEEAMVPVHSGGCAVAGPGAASSNASLLGLLGLCALWLRRRAR